MTRLGSSVKSACSDDIRMPANPGQLAGVQPAPVAGPPCHAHLAWRRSASNFAERTTTMPRSEVHARCEPAFLAWANRTDCDLSCPTPSGFRVRRHQAPFAGCRVNESKWTQAFMRPKAPSTASSSRQIPCMAGWSMAAVLKTSRSAVRSSILTLECASDLSRRRVCVWRGTRGGETEVANVEIEGRLRRSPAASVRHTAQRLGEVHAASRCAQRDKAEEFED